MLFLDLFVLASDVGVVLLASLVAGVVVDLVGMEYLLGGFADLSLADRSRTLTL